jgi:chromosome partitioning protein
MQPLLLAISVFSHGFAGQVGWVSRASQSGLAFQINTVCPPWRTVQQGLQIQSCQVGNVCVKLEGMFIAFTNTKGGVGKSTLAAHLAIWLFDRGYRVALLDTDPQGTSSEWVRNAEPKITVRATSDSDAIQLARNELLARHDFVIADAPGEEGEAANAVTFLADLAILPLEPTKPCVRALKDALKTIRLAHTMTNGQRPETVLVFNKVHKRSVRTSVLRQQLDPLMHVAKSEVRFLDALADACDSAVGRERSAKARKAATDIENLFMELFDERLAQRKVGNE